MNYYNPLKPSIQSPSLLDKCRSAIEELHQDLEIL